MQGSSFGIEKPLPKRGMMLFSFEKTCLVRDKERHLTTSQFPSTADGRIDNSNLRWRTMASEAVNSRQQSLRVCIKSKHEILSCMFCLTMHHLFCLPTPAGLSELIVPSKARLPARPRAPTSL